MADVFSYFQVVPAMSVPSDSWRCLIYLAKFSRDYRTIIISRDLDSMCVLKALVVTKTFFFKSSTNMSASFFSSLSLLSSLLSRLTSQVFRTNSIFNPSSIFLKLSFSLMASLLTALISAYRVSYARWRSG